MSITGCIYRVSTENLDDFKRSPRANPTFDKKMLYLDSFFWDINYVLTKYSELVDSEASKIILGSRIIQEREMHFAYSTYEDNIEIKQLLNEISVDKFIGCLNKALDDKESLIKSYQGETTYREGLVSLFRQLKDFYGQAVNEGLCTIYIHG